MRRVLLGLGLLVLTASAATAQQVAPTQPLFMGGEPGFLDTPSITRTSVNLLEVQGDTLWIGPYLNITTDGGETFQRVVADSLGPRVGRPFLPNTNRVFSLTIKDDVVLAGLGDFVPAQSAQGGFDQSGAGLLLSFDGGETFDFVPAPLEQPGDTLVDYGTAELYAQPLLSARYAPPFGVAYDAEHDVIYAATSVGGLRRSRDRGETWERVPLPPDIVDRIAPPTTSGATLGYTLFPFGSDADNRQAGNYGQQAYDVLVDEAGTVWVGTGLGVVRSREEDRVVLRGEVYRAWQRFGFDDTPEGLVGAFVQDLAEQPLPDARNPIWISSGSTAPLHPDQNGVTVTYDGGATFEQVLTGVSVNDFAFAPDGRVYAAAESGLFWTDDGGQTWRSERTFGTTTQPPARAVAILDGTLWVGTTQGLFKSTDGAQTFKLFRPQQPLDPEEGPAVETFVYPNPYRPATDGPVRIRYDVPAGSDASALIQVFDFAMNLVREIETPCDERLVGSEGQTECTATWDGVDRRGLRVANGVYFYTVEAAGETVRGKILILE